MRVFRSVVIAGIFGAVLLGLAGAPHAAAVTWTVAVQAAPNPAPSGQAITVTVSTNYSLQNTGYELRLMLDGSKYIGCSSSPCSAPIIEYEATSRRVSGELWGPDPDCGRSVICQTVLIEPSSTLTISWFAASTTAPAGGSTGGTTDRPTASGTSADGSWTVTLSASFSEALVGESVILSASLNRPLGDSGLSVRIVDQETGDVLADCSSGSRCQATATSEEPIASAFVAEVVAADGSAVVRSDALPISWAAASVEPIAPVASSSGGGFPMGVVLFVVAAALIVGGLVAWAFRTPN